MLEAYEATYMGLNPRNYRYPLVRGAENVAIGDTWISNVEELKFYVSMGKSPKPVVEQGGLETKEGKTIKEV